MVDEKHFSTTSFGYKTSVTQHVSRATCPGRNQSVDAGTRRSILRSRSDSSRISYAQQAEEVRDTHKSSTDLVECNRPCTRFSWQHGWSKNDLALESSLPQVGVDTVRHDLDLPDREHGECRSRSHGSKRIVEAIPI